MNKKQFLAAAFCLMALAGCTQKTELPENPKDQEEYRDHQGNSWIYNAMLMRLGINAVYGQTDFLPHIIIIPNLIRGQMLTERKWMLLQK